jgi:curved DNA-binding protein
MFTHYETLGIPRTANPEQIKRTYRVLVRRFHPDLFTDGSEEQAHAGERLRQVNAAYAILSRPEKRATYDAKLTKRKSFCFEPKPECCEKCGKLTLYWQTGRDVPLCNECSHQDGF